MLEPRVNPAAPHRSMRRDKLSKLPSAVRVPVSSNPILSSAKRKSLPTRVPTAFLSLRARSTSPTSSNSSSNSMRPCRSTVCLSVSCSLSPPAMCSLSCRTCFRKARRVQPGVGRRARVQMAPWSRAAPPLDKARVPSREPVRVAAPVGPTGSKNRTPMWPQNRSSSATPNSSRTKAPIRSLPSGHRTAARKSPSFSTCSMCDRARFTSRP